MKPAAGNCDFSFQPRWLVRNRHIQAALSSYLRQRGPALQRAAREVILDAGEGVRLLGLYSPQQAGQARGLVLLLHGWLGSAQANYVVAVGDYLYRRGYAIFRLNLRDHGGTHRLNPGAFRSDLLDEVFGAAQRVAQLAPDRPLHLVGASLGGNFALRLAWRHSQSPRFDLGHTIAICPAVDPYSTTLALDTGPWVYLAYFRRKWRQAMHYKKAAFPELYDFSEIITARTCLEMTDLFMRRYSPYPDALTYFKSYTVTPAMMSGLVSPATVLAAADDPVVPIADFEPFAGVSPQLRLHRLTHGGHVGFIDILPYRHWLSEVAYTILENC